VFRSIYGAAAGSHHFQNMKLLIASRLHSPRSRGIPRGVCRGRYSGRFKRCICDIEGKFTSALAIKFMSYALLINMRLIGADLACDVILGQDVADNGAVRPDSGPCHRAPRSLLPLLLPPSFGHDLVQL